MAHSTGNRQSIFYVRVKPENKAILEKAKGLNLSESAYCDRVLDLLRTTEAGEAILSAVEKEAHSSPPVIKVAAKKKR